MQLASAQMSAPVVDDAVSNRTSRAPIPLGVAYVVLSAWMFWQEREMRRQGATGIVGLELAGSAARVDEILTAWGPAGRAAARRSLLIDFGVLASYGPAMAALCRRSARRLERQGSARPARLGPVMASGQILAAACDVAENTALLAVLAGRRGRLPAIARASAAVKFSLLGAGALYICLGLRPRR
jgi:hypothetical protein